MSDLISPEYAQLNAKLHESNENYGTSGQNWAPLVRILSLLARTNTLLDYGCGKQTLAAALPGLRVTPYDPAIPGLEKLPAPHHLVVCGDVLEHIEPDRTEKVLEHIASLTKRITFIVLSTRPSSKTLESGENAHRIIRPADWWMTELQKHFQPLCSHYDNSYGELVVVAIPRRPFWRYLEMRALFCVAGLRLQDVFFRHILSLSAKRERRKVLKCVQDEP